MTMTINTKPTIVSCLEMQQEVFLICEDSGWFITDVREGEEGIFSTDYGVNFETPEEAENYFNEFDYAVFENKEDRDLVVRRIEGREKVYKNSDWITVVHIYAPDALRLRNK